jgi:hypothetical protein
VNRSVSQQASHRNYRKVSGPNSSGVQESVQVAACYHHVSRSVPVTVQGRHRFGSSGYQAFTGQVWRSCRVHDAGDINNLLEVRRARRGVIYCVPDGNCEHSHVVALSQLLSRTTHNYLRTRKVLILGLRPRQAK